MKKDEGRQTPRRSYRPELEALEALRLLSDGVAAPLLPSSFIEHQTIPVPPPADPVMGSEAAWDTALDQTSLGELLAQAPAVVPAQSISTTDAGAFSSGLDQLNRYLSRTWSRAGIPPQQQDDCTQAVYETLLQNLGRDGFDQLVGDVGRLGVREVFSRETPEGPDFFRAIDMVKKRAQREKSYVTLDDVQHDLASTAGGDGASADWQGALREAMARSLNPRETALIQDTLLGKTPAEIASQWGVAPKTVSNEKTRAIQKLRDALTADFAD